MYEAEKRVQGVEPKQRNLRDIFKEVEHDFRQMARTREQSVQTAKLLFQLADSAMRVEVEECRMIYEQEQNAEESEETEAVLSFG